MKWTEIVIWYVWHCVRGRKGFKAPTSITSEHQNSCSHGCSSPHFLALRATIHPYLSKIHVGDFLKMWYHSTTVLHQHLGWSSMIFTWRRVQDLALVPWDECIKISETGCYFHCSATADVDSSHACHRFCNCCNTHTLSSLLRRCRIPCACHKTWQLNAQKWSEHVVFCY